MARHLLAWFAVLLAIGGTAGGLGYYKYAEISAAIAAAEAFPEPREAVEAVRVRRGEWAASTRAVGTVVALRQVELRNELAGTVVEMGLRMSDGKRNWKRSDGKTKPTLPVTLGDGEIAVMSRVTDDWGEGHQHERKITEVFARDADGNFIRGGIAADSEASFCWPDDFDAD